MKPDGTIHRARRSIVLGTVKHVSKLQAIEALRPYLDAVNLVAMPKPKAGRTLKNFVEEWKHNVAPTLKPSTVQQRKAICAHTFFPQWVKCHLRPSAQGMFKHSSLRWQQRG